MKKQLLLEQLIEYSHTDMYPFHMPGHKRNAEMFPNPYTIDITEIEGFDNLHHPEDVLKESMEWAASVYGADRTYYLVNGSTGGILSAILGTVKTGGRILVSRNCHKSVYHGILLGSLNVEYIYPQLITPLGIQGGILPEDVEKLLMQNRDIEAVLIVSPTYEGIVSDIKGLAEVIHRYGIPLIVDEAHGAHFPFGKEAGFPESALSCGADIVIQSLHKTLPSFTQTAVMHIKDGFVKRERLERYLQMFQSSSPSYVLMAGMESCINVMEKDGDMYLKSFSQRIKYLREMLSQMRHMRLVGRELCGLYGIRDVDESKIVVSVRDCLWIDHMGKEVCADGEWLIQVLRKEFFLEMEMCSVDYIVAIATFCDTQEGLQRFTDALLEIDGRLVRGCLKETGKVIGRASMVCPVIKETISDAMDALFDEVRLLDCVGRVSAEFVYLYPPGIPIVAPGEVITEEISALVIHYQKIGLQVQGMADPEAMKLRVMR